MTREPHDDRRAEPASDPGAFTPARREAFIENSIQQAIRRGEFDDLPGAGKPIEGLGHGDDPDWWVKRKIREENLSGLGPPAILLRIESNEFDERIDEFTREVDAREYVEDFNARVVAARRQLLGGPPVVTATRDVDVELEAWRARRAERFAARVTEAIPPKARRRWWRRSG